MRGNNYDIDEIVSLNPTKTKAKLNNAAMEKKLVKYLKCQHLEISLEFNWNAFKHTRAQHD